MQQYTSLAALLWMVLLRFPCNIRTYASEIISLSLWLTGETIFLETQSALPISILCVVRRQSALSRIDTEQLWLLGVHLHTRWAIFLEWIMTLVSIPTQSSEPWLNRQICQYVWLTLDVRVTLDQPETLSRGRCYCLVLLLVVKFVCIGWIFLGFCNGKNNLFVLPHLKLSPYALSQTSTKWTSSFFS